MEIENLKWCPAHLIVEAPLTVVVVFVAPNADAGPEGFEDEIVANDIIVATDADPCFRRRRYLEHY